MGTGGKEGGKVRGHAWLRITAKSPRFGTVAGRRITSPCRGGWKGGRREEERGSESKGDERVGGGGGGVGRVLRGGSRLPLRLASRVTCRSVLVLHGAGARHCPPSLARLGGAGACGGTGATGAATWDGTQGAGRWRGLRCDGRRCGGGRCATARVRVRLAQCTDGMVCWWSQWGRCDGRGCGGGRCATVRVRVRLTRGVLVVGYGERGCCA